MRVRGALLVVLPCVGLISLFAVVCQATPIADVPEAVYDFGVAVEGAVVEHTYLIHNKGDSELSILDVQVTCGCTAPSLSSTSVPPGDTIRLTVRFDTAGYGGSTVSRPIIVRTNAAENARFTLRIEGTVIASKPYFFEAKNVFPFLMLVVDLRPLSAYVEGHLLGAVNLDPLEVDTWVTKIPATIPVLLYDQAGEVAPAVAEQMLRGGFSSVRVLLGGLDEWTREYGTRLIVTFATVFIPLD